MALVVVSLLSLVACSRAKSGDRKPEGTQLETQTLRHQAAVGQVSYPELAADLGYLAPVELQFVGNTISGPQDIQTVATGDVDFGLAFHGAIIKLIAAGAPIRAVVGGYGVDEETFSGFFVKEDSNIRSPRDLIGKQVAMNTLGAHAELMTREYLSRGGLTAEEIKKVTLVVLPPVNTEQSLRAGNIDVAALTGIFRDKALARGGLRQVFSDFELYGKFTAGSYVFTKRFIEKNPNTVRKFVDGVGRAIEWARTTPREQVIERQRAIIAKRKRQENDEVVQYWKSTGIAGTGGQLHDRELQMWIDWLVKDGELKPG
ncbi:MAG TPA: ABC transporter substrate-binding protein, partial [Polyangiales bacterium]|nr:ABC transporter substrate-binding protein [Polyangiales bacterium]